MNRRWPQIILAVFLFSGALQPLDSWGAPVTTITVDSTADPDTSKSTTCANATPCTLRRAIVQAYALPSGQRPVLIGFNISTSDPGYDSDLGLWKIQLIGSTNDDLRYLYGQATVNGATQPGGGRTSGPKSVIDGQGKKNVGFNLYNGGTVVRGVAMQNFKTHISIGSDANTVAYNRFGLWDDGQLLSAEDEVTPEGGSGIVVTSGSDSNVIRGNIPNVKVTATDANASEPGTNAGTFTFTRDTDYAPPERLL